MSKTIARVLCLALAVAAVPAGAETRQVRYDNLDLTTDAGLKTLNSRVLRAARSVCGYWDSLTTTRMVSRDVTRCMTQALAGAQEQVARITSASPARRG